MACGTGHHLFLACHPRYKEGGRGGYLCQPCDVLQVSKALRDTLDYAVLAAPKSDYLRLGIGPLVDRLRSTCQHRDAHRLHTLSVQRKVDVLCGVNDDGVKLVVALRTGQYPRIGHFLDTHMSKGRSLKYCIGVLEKIVGVAVE